MVLLRAHAPERYRAWRDEAIQPCEHSGGVAELFRQAIRHVAEDALFTQELNPERPADAAAYRPTERRYVDAIQEQDREIAALRAAARLPAQDVD